MDHRVLSEKGVDINVAKENMSVKSIFERNRRFWTLVFVVLVAGLWFWLLHDQVDILLPYVLQLSPVVLIISILCAALYFIGLAAGWTLLLRSVEAVRPVALMPGMRVWLLSMVARYVPGNVWHIVGRAAMADQLRVSRAGVLISATIEQMLTLLGSGILVLLTLPMWPVGFFDISGLPTPTLIIAFAVSGLLFVHPGFLNALLSFAARLLRKPGVQWHFSYQMTLKFVVFYTFVNIFAGLSLFVLLSGLIAVDPRNMPFIIGSAAMAWIVGYVSFLTPSGLGVREGALTALLVLAFPLPVVIAASLLFRFVMTLGELLAVLMFWLTRRTSVSPDVVV